MFLRIAPGPLLPDPSGPFPGDYLDEEEDEEMWDDNDYEWMDTDEEDEDDGEEW